MYLFICKEVLIYTLKPDSILMSRFALLILDAPVFISHPHFYNADPTLLQTVNGLSPNEHDHGLFIDIHPVRKYSHTVYKNILREA